MKFVCDARLQNLNSNSNRSTDRPTDNSFKFQLSSSLLSHNVHLLFCLICLCWSARVLLLFFNSDIVVMMLFFFIADGGWYSSVVMFHLMLFVWSGWWLFGHLFTVTFDSVSLIHFVTIELFILVLSGLGLRGLRWGCLWEAFVCWHMGLVIARRVSVQFLMSCHLMTFKVLLF